MLKCGTNKHLSGAKSAVVTDNFFHCLDPWPDSKMSILAIVVTYYILSGILTYILPHYYPDHVVSTIEGSRNTAALFVQSKMDPFDKTCITASTW